MHRSKNFFDKSSEHILNFIKKYEDEMTDDNFICVVKMCEGFNEICETLEYIQKHKGSNTYSDAEKHIPDSSMQIDGVRWFIKNIKDELTATEKYYNEWMKTKNPQFKAILARQEWEHAGALLKMIETMHLTQEERAELQKLSEIHHEWQIKLA